MSLRISSWIPSIKYSARASLLLIPDCPTRFLKSAMYSASFPFFWHKFFSAALAYPPSSIGVNALVNIVLNSSYVLSYDFPGSLQNGKYAENNSGQERTKSRMLPVTDKDLASTYVLCCPSPTCP